MNFIKAILKMIYRVRDVSPEAANKNDMQASRILGFQSSLSPNLLRLILFLTTGQNFSSKLNSGEYEGR